MTISHKSRSDTNTDHGVDEKAFFLKVLDDLVSLNTLFTSAVFMGISLATAGQHSLDLRPECDTDISAAKRLVFFEITSFSFFLLSGLLAKTNKFYIYIYENRSSLNPKESKLCMYLLYISAYGSCFGCGFLIASLVEIIRIRVGRFSCGSPFGIGAVSVLCVLALPAILVYVLSVSYHLVAFGFPRVAKQARNVTD